MRRHCAGYTLIEILVVVFIISILIGLILGCLAVARQRAMVNRTTFLMSSLRGAIELYQDDHREYPLTQTANGFDGGESLYLALRSREKGAPYLSGDFVVCDEDRDGTPEIADAWGRAFRYLHPRSYGRRNPNGRTYRLWSVGADGHDRAMADSSDDITNWDNASAEKTDGD